LNVPVTDIHINRTGHSYTHNMPLTKLSLPEELDEHGKSEIDLGTPIFSISANPELSISTRALSNR
ncbi:Hypothetical predicted protein, partial [Pelobates cultripes]